MISITLDNVGKKFNKEWIFRRLHFEIIPGEKIVILGGNGSGKSTLLQVISGYVTASEGKIIYRDTQNQNSEIEQEEMRKHLSFASPYLQLIEDFTAAELIQHLAPAKPFLSGLSSDQIIEIAQLNHARHKFIRQYSSGMKQRLKLALAILADTSTLLLDEPLSNLDKNGTEWYKKMIVQYAAERTVLVCSNAISEEYYFCERSLTVSDHKQ